MGEWGVHPIPKDVICTAFWAGRVHASNISQCMGPPKPGQYSYARVPIVNACSRNPPGAPYLNNGEGRVSQSQLTSHFLHRS